MVLTDAERLALAKSALDKRWTEYEALDSTAAGGKPDMAGPGSIGHMAYRKQLWAEIKELEAEVTSMTGPTVSVSHGII